MKKFCSLLMILLCLTGCSKKEALPKELPNDPIDTSGKRVVIYCGGKAVPLSYTIDGEQQIQNGIYWYYELDGDFLKNSEDKFYSYDEITLDLNGGGSIENLEKNKSFITNGGWPLFLTPVHTQYTLSNQNKVDELVKKQADAQLIANGINGTNAVITDVWNCDLDQDGVEETLFLAKNEEGEQRYCFLGYVNGENCQILSGFYNLGKLPELRPIICDFEGDGKWSVLLYESCHYQKFSAFDFNNGTFTKAYDIIF